MKTINSRLATLIKTLPFLLLLIMPITANPQQLVTITDVSGAVIKLNTYSFSIDYGLGGLSYPVSMGAGVRNVYKNQSVMAIQLENKAILFIEIAKISEYISSGKSGTLILISGEHVAGTLLKSEISGNSALGDISISSEKIKSVKFNRERMGHYIKKLINPAISYGDPKKYWSYYFPIRYWTMENNIYESDADITLNSGDVYSLRHCMLIRKKVRYSSHHIPAKYISYWIFGKSIFIKYGESSVEVELSKIKSLEFSKNNNSDTAQGNIDLKLKNGENVIAILDIKSDNSPVGFLGTNEIGCVHVSIEEVKSIVFTSDKGK